MKAALATKYGPPEVIEIREIAKPVTKKNEILVKVKTTAVTAGDVRIRGSKFPRGFKIPARLALGIFAPRFKILGTEFAGVVEGIGSEVKNFKIGDEVIGFKLFGVHAEYVCINENKAVIHKPKNLSFEEAAAIPFGGSTALYFLNKAKIKADESVLVNGASGEVGSMLLQIAKAYGAEVTAVTSAKNIELVKSLGTDNVIDYTQEDFLLSSVKYDAIFDAVGNLNFKKTLKVLNPDGRFAAIVAGIPEMLGGSFTKKPNGIKFIQGTAGEKKEELETLVKLVSEGKLKPVIGKVFDFDNIREAHAYVDSGHKVGAAVISIKN